ncbi:MULTISPECIES: SRPBCC family protein [unclassified Xanthobacter]|uniref:SRPBCC family protein n=1 Tax=unclassified Xanthobacter TaxID=2623496 RepID=UPI001EDD2421|nr:MULTISPECIES: carbon monoxide dehydrogenase subunit G [unclassified Xanthobacter]
MALEMTGECDLAASRETVYAALNDENVLKQCIPGCEEIERLGPDELRAVVVAKVGPVKAKFKGKVTLSDREPPSRYRITGEGDGGISGFAKGGALVTLTELPEGGTRLVYEVEAQIGGKLAQLGQRLIAGTAKKNADAFFENLVKLLAPSEDAA